MTSFHPELLTWTALLGKWVDFAQASLALPQDAEGKRWRQSVVPIINLQAVTFALADLELLIPADRAVARDKAAILVEKAAEDLQAIWDRSPQPELLMEILKDARLALAGAGIQKSGEPG